MYGDNDKLRPQMRGIIEFLRAEALDDDGMGDPIGYVTAQGKLVDGLIADSEGSRHYCNTVQTARRIWEHYRKDLIEGGYITMSD